jgi:hypothetical protein
MSITLQGRSVMVDGFPVSDVEDLGDHMTRTELNGRYLDIYIQRKGGTFYGVIIDLDTVGLDDEAVVKVNLDPSVQVALPPRQLLNQAA